MGNKYNLAGGIRLSDQTGITTRADALATFLVNSTFSVLTNDSISCITLVATLNLEPEFSPFRIVRSNGFDKPITKLLLKIFITANQQDWQEIQGRGQYNGVEITSITNFKKEIDIQREIYHKSFLSESSMLEGMCPHIINWHHCTPNGGTVQYFGSLNGLSTDEQEAVNEILNGAADVAGRQISYIAMEFMDGYQVANNFFPENTAYQKLPETASENFLLELLQYEFHRLNTYGYIHGDAHLGNVMINADYDYMLDEDKGRALIIDFGRTVKRPEPYDYTTIDNQLERFRNEQLIAPAFLIDIGKFISLSTRKRNNMHQFFYPQFGNYLQNNGHNNNGTYQEIYEILLGIISEPSGQEVYNILGGATIEIENRPVTVTENNKSNTNQQNTKTPFDDVPFDVFKSNLKAMFDDKANGEIKGELFASKKKGGKRFKTKRNKEKKPRSTKKPRNTKKPRKTKKPRSTKKARKKI